jgi:two-component system, NarL family, sensor histidine kinase DevS
MEEPLPATEAELRASRRQVAELARELEETNRGIIALHTELESARQAEAHLAAIVRSSDDAMLSVSPDGVIRTWNPGAERLLGYRAAEIVGQAADLLIPAELLDQFERTLERIRSASPQTYDTRRRRKDGSLVDVAVTLSAMRDAGGRLIGMSAVLRDITGRLRAEDALAAARADQEVRADRDRMATDLRDRVIGRIFAAGMTLQTAASLAGRPEVTARIETAVRELDVSIDEIRDAIFALRHVRPGPVGLRARVLDLASEAADALGFAPEISFAGPLDSLPDDLCAQLLAVIREGLSDVARYAGASAAAVTLTAASDLVLRVSHNGRGLDNVTRSSGLRNMRERAQAVGGTFSVSSQDGWARLEWRIPLHG